MQDVIVQFLTEVERERRFSTHTVAAYRNDLTQFRAYLATPPARDGLPPLPGWEAMTTDHLGRYLLHLRERDYAASTVARKTAAIKSFCGYLFERQLCPVDPKLIMVSPRVEKFVPRALTVAEVVRLMDAPRADDASRGRPEALRDRAMLELLYATGMRVSELISLDVGDVTEAGIHVRANQPKRDRQIAISHRSRGALSDYLDGLRRSLPTDAQPSLFVNHRGQRLTRQGFWLILKARAHQVGIEGVTPHTLRHTCAAHALQRGADIDEVQRMLGHVSQSTTRVYRHVPGDPGESLAPDLRRDEIGRILDMESAGAGEVAVAMAVMAPRTVARARTIDPSIMTTMTTTTTEEPTR